MSQCCGWSSSRAVVLATAVVFFVSQKAHIIRVPNLMLQGEKKHGFVPGS